MDSVDLIQLHNLVEEDEWDQAMGPDGVLAALVRARDEGLARFIGVTGHGLRIARMHLRSLERHPFDSVLLPYSFVTLQDDAYRADVERLLEVCAEGEVAVQTIKSVARRRWPEDHSGPRHSWYEPLEDLAVVDRAVRWVLARPQLFLNTSSDVRLLPMILESAARHSAGDTAPPSDDALHADLTAHGVRPLFDWSTLERI